ncbi:hypothetical protein JCM19235_5479 [Vibrio maritimus]|uniref:Uncharacterized protein n=1 Tax=Vibrio maritimus TaxID=990268 RepID=A0A090RND2_9VIBR|nr:hypothetical protein JCM19235_5479 [Vibrio maritimus]
MASTLEEQKLQSQLTQAVQIRPKNPLVVEKTSKKRNG